MSTLKSLLRLVAGCAHHDTYRERRTLHGVEVLHFVCHDCGHAVPAIDRTADEHQAIVRAGAVNIPHARPVAIYKVRRSA